MRANVSEAMASECDSLVQPAHVQSAGTAVQTNAPTASLTAP